MSNVLASERELARRGQHLRKRLKSLVPKAPYIELASQPVGLRDKAIGLREGHTDLPYTEWRVRLRHADLAISYYEIWCYSEAASSPGTKRPRPKRKGPWYILHRAYLHLYRARSPLTEEKLIFLHCDPQDPDRFKMAPHLHFEVAPEPWRRAHIALCHGWQDQVLENLEALDRAFQRAIELLSQEVIARLQTGD